jgi:hypothetical protein
LRERYYLRIWYKTIPEKDYFTASDGRATSNGNYIVRGVAGFGVKKAILNMDKQDAQDLQGSCAWVSSC